MDATIRPYDPERDRSALWACKRGFEEGLGAGTGDDAKQSRYADKLTATYREEWLAWVDRCTDDDERCVTVASTASAPGGGQDREDSDDTDSGRETAGDAGTGHLLGYVFVLPERLAYIWDAAVLNEIFVVPEARGSGVADDLMVAAEGLASEQSLPLDRLVLDVDRENDRAVAFYERHGFEHWGEMVAKKC